MKKLILTLVLMLAMQVQASEVPNLSADEALTKLKQGNEHFVQMHLKHPNVSKQRRVDLTKGQHPFVAVLSCSDSRVPTEIIFDQGLGDIFVIRNAGNVLDEHVIGSIEYAVHHLGVNLVVVMGHETCGAVAATMQGGKESPDIETLKKSIEPAVCLCEKSNACTPENVTKTHAQLNVEALLKNEELGEYVEKHHLKIVPAYYHLNTGFVEYLN